MSPAAFANEVCNGWESWSKPACQHLASIFNEGDMEVYLSGYAWHNRYVYPEHKISSYNENAWGGGLGKGRYDERGNWQGVYAFAFLDSHKNVEPIAGYAYLKVAHLSTDVNLGAGLTVFITSRPDIFNSIPFPGLLPWVSLTLKRATLSATYIPGAKGAGNVLFIVGKWRL